MRNSILPLMSAVPLGAAFLTAFIPKRRVNLARAAALLAMFILTILALLISGKDFFYEMGGWAPPTGIALRSDSFSSLILLSVSVAGMLITAFGGGEIKKYTSASRFYVLLLLLTAGINGTLLAGDIFNRFVFAELAVISSYVLVGFACTGRGLFAAFKYALLGATASAITLMGIAVIYSLYGTLDIALISEAAVFPQPFNELLTPPAFAAALIFAGFAVKAALTPFHIWAPDALERAPSVSASFISSALIPSVGVYALLRTAFSVFGITGRFAILISFVGVISMLAGAVLSLKETGGKRKAVYLMISHTGFIIAGFGVFARALVMENFSAASAAFSGAMLLLIVTPLVMPMLFLPEKDAPSRPGFLAVSGLPPFASGFGRLFVVYAAFAAGFSLTAAVASAGWAIALFSAKKAISGSSASSLIDERPGVRAAVILFAVVSIIAGAMLLPGVGGSILRRAAYALSGAEGLL